MRTIRRVAVGTVVSLFAVVLVSDASTSGKGALLLLAFVLGWFEWRAWKKARPVAGRTAGTGHVSH